MPESRGARGDLTFAEEVAIVSLVSSEDPGRHPLDHPVSVAEVIQKNDGSLIVVVVLHPELSQRSRLLCEEFGISEKALLDRVCADVFHGSVRREYVSVVREEANLRRLLAARAGQASTEELSEIVRQIERLKTITVELVRDLALVRDPVVELLLEEDVRYQWPDLPPPPALPRPGGRPRVGETNDLSFLRLVFAVTRAHDREEISYAAAAARCGISEKQFYAYRQRARELGLLSDDD